MRPLSRTSTRGNGRESGWWRSCPFPKPLPRAACRGTPVAPFLSDQPGFDKVTMGDFLSAAARREHDLFYGARIGLYPGEIDKLW
jgi:aminoglycoside 2'-N-acetyltransferase I